MYCSVPDGVLRKGRRQKAISEVYPAVCGRTGLIVYSFLYTGRTCGPVVFRRGYDRDNSGAGSDPEPGGAGNGMDKDAEEA